MNNNFEKMQRERIGMFVHYGIYSTLGGEYNGEVIDGFAEWIMRAAKIPIAEYEKIAKDGFCPAPDFAINLVLSAKKAGAKYIVLTSKHHDGFCLFKSEADSYNSYSLLKRDLCRELADACRSEGIGLGFYYSHTLDWHEKNAAGNSALCYPDIKKFNRNFWDYPDDNIDFEEYFRRKCLPQVRELLTNYGELECIWFDFPHDITLEQTVELRELVKSLQPNCLINSRIGFGQCDYYSLGDNCLPTTPAVLPTECLITLNETWGYKASDLNYKTPEAVIGTLCRALSTDSTLLVNVGPMADGSLTEQTLELLSELGKWTTRNEAAIYGGVKAAPFKSVFPWGFVTVKENSMFIYQREKKETVKISGIGTRPVLVLLLGDDKPIEFSYSNNTLTLKAESSDYTCPVYRIDFREPPLISTELEIDSTRSSLPVVYASLASRTSPEDTRDILKELNVEDRNFGKCGISVTRIDSLQNWSSSDEFIVWDVNFLEPGIYSAELVCVEPAFETRCVRADVDEDYYLTVGNTQNKISSEIKSSYNLSKSGSANLRYLKDAGEFNISDSGPYRVTLSKALDTLGVGVIELRFIKK